ncbi:CLUMA_CG012285, isoform A [Clunio marinus]|uniref:CLUMA_CG012285, isoform A n=1 Tax=Clunio marinus TaxID=568069 RepID=A0A1J1IJ11_9DIPT|nr:CLUMA_CG012285, isoform A [Clunio marinus]
MKKPTPLGFMLSNNKQAKTFDSQLTRALAAYNLINSAINFILKEESLKSLNGFNQSAEIKVRDIDPSTDFYLLSCNLSQTQNRHQKML